MSSLEKLNKKRVPTLAELTAVSNYKNSLVVKHYAGMNIHKALNSNAKSVGLMSKENEEKTRLCISNLFIATSKYFDKELNARQSEVIAEEILFNYEYRQLKLEDILAICIEIKESDTFKLTPARILRFISDYTNRREKLAIERSRKISEEAKAQGDSNLDERIHKSVRMIDKTTEIVIKNRLKRY